MLIAAVAVSMLYLPTVAFAVAAPALATPTGLSLAEIKMTGTEFIMLQNNTGNTITNLTDYSLYGFNNVNPLAPGVNISVQQLPTGNLLPGQTVLLSDGGATCGAAITADLSIGLTDGSGFVQVVKSSFANGQVVQASGDSVSWSSGANSSPGMIANVPSNTLSPLNAYYRIQNPASSGAPFLWQKANQNSSNLCELNVVGQTGGPTNPGNQLLPGLPPPATVISIPIQKGTNGSGGIPASDIGLRAPVLNELLPNPIKPQTDADDEFIEIYNPNKATFDLSGFKLQVKSATSSSKRTYTFPNGTKIASQKFAAYPSSNITISLNNAGAQVWLLDPNEGIISKSDAYGEGEEGQAWALADGKWYWTDTPTPNAANEIKAVGGSGTGTNGNGVGTVNGSNIGTDGLPTGSGLARATAGQNTSLHPAILAVVGGLALLYGAYEYRHDIANQVHKAKRYRAARAANRPETAWWRRFRTRK